ncbi:MAG: cyclomaltodextrinase N-terminal domain-containing protein, partial [Ginsengibacter sp.]
MKYIKKLLYLSLLFWLNPVNAQQVECYPLNWWVQMKNPRLQIMLHGKDVANGIQYTINYPGVKIEKVIKVENVNYVFLDLLILPSCRAGDFTIIISGKNNYKIKYSLKSRRQGNGTKFAQGVNSNDLIYLIMPDRFSNGDTSNDRIFGMRDQSLNRDSVYARHGGDLKGIQNHLDYFKSLGINTLWLNPVIENDMYNRTEHGYAFTNHYKIDPRIGGEVAYHQLIDA